MHLQNARTLNPLMVELVDLEPGTPVRLTTDGRWSSTLEGRWVGLGPSWSEAAEYTGTTPLSAKVQTVGRRYPSGVYVDDLVALELLDELTATCRTCKASFAVPGKVAPRECPTCSAATQAAGAAALEQYAMGRRVEVHAFGHWYTGVVVKIARSTVTVHYRTGSGAERDKTVNASGGLIRPLAEVGA